MPGDTRPSTWRLTVWLGSFGLAQKNETKPPEHKTVANLWARKGLKGQLLHSFFLPLHDDDDLSLHLGLGAIIFLQRSEAIGAYFFV